MLIQDGNNIEMEDTLILDSLIDNGNLITVSSSANVTFNSYTISNVK